MSSDVIPNFSSAEDAMKAAESFCRKAAGICDKSVERVPHPRSRQVLGHAAKVTATLADSLASQYEQGDRSATKMHVQYTPIEPAPSDEELKRLEASVSSADATVDTLVSASQRWAHIFAQLRDASSTTEAQELHDGCRELFEGWGKELTTAYHQAQEM